MCSIHPMQNGSTAEYSIELINSYFYFFFFLVHRAIRVRFPRRQK